MCVRVCVRGVVSKGGCSVRSFESVHIIAV